MCLYFNCYVSVDGVVTVSTIGQRSLSDFMCNIVDIAEHIPDTPAKAPFMGMITALQLLDVELILHKHGKAFKSCRQMVQMCVWNPLSCCMNIQYILMAESWFSFTGQFRRG